MRLRVLKHDGRCQDSIGLEGNTCGLLCLYNSSSKARFTALFVATRKVTPLVLQMAVSHSYILGGAQHKLPCQEQQHTAKIIYQKPAV